MRCVVGRGMRVRRVDDDPRPDRSVRSSGAASPFAFKAQAVFIAPFIIGALIGRRAPLWQWSLPAADFRRTDDAGMARRLAGLAPGDDLSEPARLDPVSRPPRQSLDRADDVRLAVGRTLLLGRISLPAPLRPTAIAALTSNVGRASHARCSCSRCCRRSPCPSSCPRCSNAISSSPTCCHSRLALSYRSRPTILFAVGVQLASFLSVWTYLYYYYWAYPTVVGAVVAAAAMVATYISPGRRAPNGPSLSVNRWLPAPCIGRTNNRRTAGQRSRASCSTDRRSVPLRPPACRPGSRRSSSP